MSNSITGDVSGPVVQVRTIEGDVRFQLPPRREPPAPAQLPAPGFFANRHKELALLRNLVEDAAPGGPPRIVVITGAGGVGKTTLALQWLQHLRARYDAQLFVDLRGFSDPGPLSPQEPLERFLRALGAAPETIPAGPDEQAALFRSMTAGLRLIVMLDNAVSAAQVRPLLPGAGGALVVVTARHRLTGLLVDGARFLHLDPLDEHGAVELLGGLIGRERTAAEREHARSLVALCGTLPLALCASGARLAARPRWTIAQAVAELHDERRRLAALRGHEGDMSVESTLNASYGALDDEHARAYRLLGLHPGPDIGVPAAAGLLDTDTDRTAELLDGLVQASLLLDEATDRYRFHDLVRLHARETAERQDTLQVRREALARLAAWYRDTAAAADRIILPGRWRLGDRHGDPLVFQNDPAIARAWLEDERANLFAVADAAHGAGEHPTAWQLCESLWPLFITVKHQRAWTELFELGRRAAEACGDRRAQARMLTALGMAHLGRSDPAAARRCHGAALELDRRADHPLGQATALEGLGLAELADGDGGRAAVLFARARDLHAELGRPRGTALMDRHIGRSLMADGRHDEAVTHFRRALEVFERDNEPYHQARTLAFLGEAHLGGGRTDEADEAFAASLAIARRTGARSDEATALVGRARVAARRRDPAAEAASLEEASRIYAALGAPRPAHVTDRLAELRPPFPRTATEPPP
ncbi:ATP-binding protein [Spirillospora sp. CA-253888]